MWDKSKAFRKPYICRKGVSKTLSRAAKFHQDPPLPRIALVMTGHLKVTSLFLMELILLWGPQRRELHTGLISLRKHRPSGSICTLPHHTFQAPGLFYQRPALNELEDGGQRAEERIVQVGALCVNKDPGSSDESLSFVPHRAKSEDWPYL